MSKIMLTILMFCVLALAACGGNVKSEAKVKMSGDALSTLIQKFDEDAKVNDNSVEFSLNERDLFLVYDTKADRMRIITPIAQAALANENILIRMLQANYDSVLDVRYAQANNVIWAVFIHPLSSLTQEDFLSGIAQAVTAAETFGSSYTSGAMVFGGGDSNAIHEDLLKQLEKATNAGKEI